MGEKLEKRLSPQELADYLADLAGQLRRGSLKVDGRAWTVPPEVDAKIHLKEEDGSVGLKLSWRWSTLPDYDRPFREAVVQRQSSFKEVKRQLGGAFARLQKIAAQGLFPEPELVTDFVEKSAAFGRLARPEWQEQMQVYMDHLENLQRAVGQRQLEEMLHELRDLAACMAGCHQEFK